MIFEFNHYNKCFISHIPIQLDGTCNGLQHYSALLRDEVGGAGVNLIDSDKPSDIYQRVADRLSYKLKEIIDGQLKQNNNDNNYVTSNDNSLAIAWLNIGINRKLTKRPVMVLPYGGTLLSCREYIEEYLKDNYSSTFIWTHFGIGENPTDCTFKVATWLSKHLWGAIQDTLQSAIVGMTYLKQVVRLRGKQYIDWLTPAGLLVRQAYPERKKKMIRTELYGNILKVTAKLDIEDTLDNQRQLNGVCPNFIHSLDASCLMSYIVKSKKCGVNSFMTVHDCYGTHAADTELSAKLLREAFVEIYRDPILDNFTADVLGEECEFDYPTPPAIGNLDIEEVLKSKYFFN